MSKIKYENEITIELSVQKEKDALMLLNKGYSLVEEYDIIDIYMLKLIVRRQIL